MVSGQMVKMEIWDTAGQERFRNITKSYYERAMGVLLVYDCSDERSFTDIRNWIKQIENHAHHGVVKALVAAKCDILEKKVEAGLARTLADEFHMQFFETSSKLGLNVEQAFVGLAEEICKKEIHFAELKSSISVKDNSDLKPKKSGCC